MNQSIKTWGSTAYYCKQDTCQPQSTCIGPRVLDDGVGPGSDGRSKRAETQEPVLVSVLRQNRGRGEEDGCSRHKLPPPDHHPSSSPDMRTHLRLRKLPPSACPEVRSSGKSQEAASIPSSSSSPASPHSCLARRGTSPRACNLPKAPVS